MLQEWKAMEKPEEEEIRARLAAAKEKLAKQQLLIKEQKIPVLVLMEGWGTAGKGSVIGQVIQNIDPRFFKVESMGGVPETVFIPLFQTDPGRGKVRISRFGLDG